MFSSQCNETNSLIGAWVISRELNESHLSLTSDWHAYYIIGSILFSAIKLNQSHTKNQPIKYIVTKCMSIISLSTKMADSLNKHCARTILSFFSMQPMKN